MAATYRPPTVDERFFGHTTFVNVPVSLPSESLPPPSAAVVDTIIPALDLTLSHLDDSEPLTGLEAFVAKHWGKILLGIVITGTIYWYYTTEKEKAKKNNANVAPN